MNYAAIGDWLRRYQQLGGSWLDDLQAATDSALTKRDEALDFIAAYEGGHV